MIYRASQSLSPNLEKKGTEFLNEVGRPVIVWHSRTGYILLRKCSWWWIGTISLHVISQCVNDLTASREWFVETTETTKGKLGTFLVASYGIPGGGELTKGADALLLGWDKATTGQNCFQSSQIFLGQKSGTALLCCSTSRINVVISLRQNIQFAVRFFLQELGIRVATLKLDISDRKTKRFFKACTSGLCFQMPSCFWKFSVSLHIFNSIARATKKMTQGFKDGLSAMRLKHPGKRTESFVRKTISSGPLRTEWNSQMCADAIKPTGFWWIGVHKVHKGFEAHRVSCAQLLERKRFSLTASQQSSTRSFSYCNSHDPRRIRSFPRLPRIWLCVLRPLLKQRCKGHEAEKKGWGN